MPTTGPSREQMLETALHIARNALHKCDPLNDWRRHDRMEALRIKREALETIRAVLGAPSCNTGAA